MVTISPFDADRYAATDATRCIKLYIPDDDSYLALVAGLLTLAGNPLNYIDPDSAQTEGVTAVFRDAYIQTTWDGCDTPPEGGNMSTSAILLPDMASVTSGATPAWTADGTSSLGGYWIANPALTGDSMFWQLFLAAGSYDIDMTYLRNTVNGKGDLKVYDADGNLLVTIAIDLRGAVQRNTVAGGSFDNPIGGRVKVEWVGTGTTGANFFRSVQRIVIDKYGELP